MEMSTKLKNTLEKLKAAGGARTNKDTDAKRFARSRALHRPRIEKIVKANHPSIPFYQLKPLELVIVCTSMMRGQVARTPHAAVTFDTTFNVGDSKMCMSIFVVQVPSLRNLFYPILYAIHESLHQDIYEQIFTEFFKIFGVFGKPGAFSGVTIEFADAIQVGYQKAWFKSSGQVMWSDLDDMKDAVWFRPLKFCAGAAFISCRIWLNLSNHLTRVFAKRTRRQLSMRRGKCWTRRKIRPKRRIN